MNVIQFFAALAIVAVVAIAMIRAFGSSVAFFYRLLLAGVRGRTFDVLYPVLVVAAITLLGYVLIESSHELLLPVPGQTYGELPFLERAGQWIVDTLSEISPQLPPLP